MFCVASPSSPVVRPSTQAGCHRRPAQLGGSRPLWVAFRQTRHSIRTVCAVNDSRKPSQTQKRDPLAGYSRNEKADIRLRGEAEAPFRPVRLLLYGFSVVSASVGFLVSVPQLIAAIGHAPNALPLDQVLQNVGINVTAAAVFAYLFAQDKKAEALQMARLGREENLGELSIELIGGKLVRLRDLRSFARVVVVAGTPDQVNEYVLAAEPFKEQLMSRGVMLCAVPIFGNSDASSESVLSEFQAEDKKYIARAVRLEGWKKWFQEQMGTANVQSGRGLYVGLRLDGRVRASGKGCPPWAQFAVELAPLEGMWKGFFDGMDGVV
mmetsp:Transcript_34359/g.97322  ORF Transcript_34359/g.97322 Transcript_34359/m.97322 type:complete len:323 (-) Transcript_34359:123-1091(-)|eukprot:CAMPEP_0117677498 /NCGR_PEP_ID=MMETSP0804-20121206/16778_1 /TAXON_ID=1074897 /ORGANISM="Tetraselmis astigmatica, Strain CCMP880" /LENGTH=322 /DNA_ID=CAMNT_0005486787 /DNA_START=63 /DNA_END=1031 /DNA_ORIENTATION=-